jgi:hypothetical protein
MEILENLALNRGAQLAELERMMLEDAPEEKHLGIKKELMRIAEEDDETVEAMYRTLAALSLRKDIGNETTTEEDHKKLVLTAVLLVGKHPIANVVKVADEIMQESLGNTEIAALAASIAIDSWIESYTKANLGGMEL